MTTVARKMKLLGAEDDKIVLFIRQDGKFRDTIDAEAAARGSF